MKRAGESATRYFAIIEIVVRTLERHEGLLSTSSKRVVCVWLLFDSVR